MAIYHLSAKLISRKAGRSATGAAAYRAGERIVDERTGLIHDYTRKGGVEHTRIVTPTGIDPPTRAGLWNAVEAKNKRADAQVAREFEVALPAEISSHGRRQLALAFARHIADTYGVAADVAIHAPGRDGDRRNHHAHILTTTNTLNPDGSLGNKARALDAVAHDRSKGDRAGPNEIEKLRETWAELVNRALQREGVDARIDHRGLDVQRAAAIERGDGRQARQLERVPTVHLGPNVARMERRGIRTERGDQGREVATRNAQIIDLAEARNRIEGERADLAEPPAGSRAALQRELNAALLAKWTNRTEADTGTERLAGRERPGPAIQSGRFRAKGEDLANSGQASPNSPLASNQTPPGRPLEAPQGQETRHPLQREGETLDQAGYRLRTAFFEAERDAWREQAAARHRETAATQAARRAELQRNRPWLFGRDEWAREVAEAARLAGVHEIRARDTLAGDWDPPSGLRPQWEAAADRRLAREYPELRKAMEEAGARKQAERLAQSRERQAAQKAREQGRTGPKRGR